MLKWRRRICKARRKPAAGKCLHTIRLHALSLAATGGVLQAGQLRLACALGPSGRSARKREGDGATPLGRWPLRRMLVRTDRLTFLASRLPSRSVAEDDGWCDDPADRNYNRPVRLPYPASHERLWRDDRIYDVIVSLGHNDRPRRRGHGSAVFMHLAKPGYPPTAGCIAVSLKDMRKLLAICGKRTVLVTG